MWSLFSGRTSIRRPSHNYCNLNTAAPSRSGDHAGPRSPFGIYQYVLPPETIPGSMPASKCRFSESCEPPDFPPKIRLAEHATPRSLLDFTRISTEIMYVFKRRCVPFWNKRQTGSSEGGVSAPQTGSSEIVLFPNTVCAKTENNIEPALEL